jgi:hypothetical protein
MGDPMVRGVVSYYDRQYGADITNGSMDISLSVGGLAFTATRVTSSSMPLPTEFADAQGNSLFFGDYAGLAVSGSAHPLWADTRDPDLFDCGTNPPALCTGTEAGGQVANDEDLFTASLPG